MAKGKSLLEKAEDYAKGKKPKRKGKKKGPRPKPRFAFKAYKKRHAKRRIVKHYRRRKSVFKRTSKAKLRYQQRLAALVKARAARARGTRKTVRRYKRAVVAKKAGFWGSITSIFGGRKAAPMKTVVIRPGKRSHASQWGHSRVTETGTLHQTMPKGHRYSVAKDKQRTAMKPGKRRTAWGTDYYEYRVNRSDKKPQERY